MVAFWRRNGHRAGTAHRVRKVAERSLVPNRERRGGMQPSFEQDLRAASLSIGRLEGSRWRGGPYGCWNLLWYGWKGVWTCRRGLMEECSEPASGCRCGCAVRQPVVRYRFSQHRHTTTSACSCTSTRQTGHRLTSCRRICIVEPIGGR